MAIPIRRKLAEDIADYLTEKIVQMEIQPGERITEAKIREIFDVSGSPVREALMILEKKHLVELVPRRGAKAAEISLEFTGNLYDVLAELGGLFARRTCEDRTEEELAWYREMVSKAFQCAGNEDIIGYVEAIRAIVLFGLEASRNPLLAWMIREWIPSFQRANFLYLSHSSFNLEDHVTSFQELLKYVVDGNAEMAERVTRSYFIKERERVLEIIRKYFAEEKDAAE